MSVYDFKVKAMDGSEVSLADYKGKVLLIVNTATGCGFTPQYDGLQVLKKKFIHSVQAAMESHSHSLQKLK